MQARFPGFPRPVVCSICNETYNDVHEHIVHMTTVHRMKASFRCSTCGDIFPSKVAIEAHLKTHADNGRSSASSKEGDKPSSSGSSILSNIQVTRSACDAENVLALDIEEDEEEDGDDDLLKEVFSCSCGKAYFLRMSFDAHQKVCPVKMQQYSSTPTSTVTGNLESSYRSQSRLSDNNNIARRSQGRGRSLDSLETLGTDLTGSESSNCRKMVESIHSDGDTNCKACQKPMKGFISLCNHLSRRNECREFYNDNFVPGNGSAEESSPAPSFLHEKSRTSMDITDKSNNSSSKSVDSLLLTKRVLTNATSSGASSTSSPATVGGGINSDSKEGQASFTDLGPDDIIIAPADELIRRAYLVRNRVQCPRCTKIFGGKTPAVAYNNHRRNKHCPATQATVPYLKAKSNNKNKDQQPSPQAADIVPPNAASNLISPHESDLKLPDQSQVRYYCKLCPSRDTKNRVSLGVHLTTYHGLPPVNISSKDGVALRCQTCYQTFNSKYFYNMHRYECDLTSPYIGILDSDKMNESEDMNTSNTSTSESKNVNNENEEDAHLPAPPPSIVPPPIQSISPTPNSSSQAHSTHRHRQQLSPTLTQKISIRASIESKTPPQSIPKVQPTFTGPPRGSAASNAYFTNNYTCTLCHKKGFPGPNAVRIHQKYQCVKRPLVPSPKSPYPSPLAKPRTKSYSRPLSRDKSQSESSESRLAILLGNSTESTESTGHLNGKDLHNANAPKFEFPMYDDCDLKDTSKQRIFSHEQASHKEYHPDVSQRVEELIERASTCAICGSRAKNYIVKAKHEVKCLEMALDSLGVKFMRFENIEDIDSDSSIVNGDSIDQSSLISVNGDVAVEDMEVEDADTEEIEDDICELVIKLSEEELEESLRRRFGINRDFLVVLEKLADSSEEEDDDDEDDDMGKEKEEEEEEEEGEGEYDDYDEDCDSNDYVDKLESLKQIFDKLLRHLIPNEEIYREIVNGKPVDAALTSILRNLGTDPLSETNHKFNDFRTNIQTFLQLSIVKETLEKASVSTRTVDEVIINLLNVTLVN